MGLFHLLSGSVLIFSASLLMILIGEKFLKIMEYYVRAFFDKYVKGVPGAVIEDLSGLYPEIFQIP
jgi:maltodextrin utilization protein YvdJ